MNSLAIHRRRLLTVGLGACVVGAIGSAGLMVSGRSQPAWILADIIRRNLPNELVSEVALTRFIHDFTPQFRRRYNRLKRLSWVYHRQAGVESPEAELLERHVITNFLLGSDVFEAGRQRHQPIEFFGVPEAGNCNNPFYRT